MTGTDITVCVFGDEQYAVAAHVVQLGITETVDPAVDRQAFQRIPTHALMRHDRTDQPDQGRGRRDRAERGIGVVRENVADQLVVEPARCGDGVGEIGIGLRPPDFECHRHLILGDRGRVEIEWQGLRIDDFGDPVFRPDLAAGQVEIEVRAAYRRA